MRLLATLVTLISLIGSQSARAATDGKRLNSDSALRLVPPAPQFPRGLPLAKRLNDGVWLPAETAHALHVYVVELEHYHEQAQAAMDALADVLATECTEQRKIDAAQAVAASDKRNASAEAHKMTFGKVAVPVGVAAALGLLGGFLLAHHGP